MDMHDRDILRSCLPARIHPQFQRVVANGQSPQSGQSATATAEGRGPRIGKSNGQYRPVTPTRDSRSRHQSTTKKSIFYKCLVRKRAHTYQCTCPCTHPHVCTHSYSHVHIPSQYTYSCLCPCMCPYRCLCAYTWLHAWPCLLRRWLPTPPHLLCEFR